MLETEKQATVVQSSPARSGAALPHEHVARTVMLKSATETETGQPSAPEMEIAHKNGVGLEFISHYPAAQVLAEQEAARQQAFWRAMRETSTLLAGRGIPHIYIKFRKLYLYYDSNVDVIVAREHWRPAIAALERDSYTGHVMFKEPDKIMFVRPGETVSVHLHPGVTWNGVPYIDDSALWRHSSPSSEGAWLELSAEYDFLINLAHNLFENYEISLGDALYFQRFLQGSRDALPMDDVAAENGWRVGYRRIHAMVVALVQAWNRARETGELSPALLAYPYRIRTSVLARAFVERIASNVASGHVRPALREAYAYPAFWALKRRHDLF